MSGVLKENSRNVFQDMFTGGWMVGGANLIARGLVNLVDCVQDSENFSNCAVDYLRVAPEHLINGAGVGVALGGAFHYLYSCYLKRKQGGVVVEDVR